MKKLKALKGALIGVFVVAAACCVFAACSSDEGDDEEETSYTPIDNSSIVEMKLDDSGVKKTYLTYQSFSSEGLEATATRESGATEVMSASDLDIDYSAFDNTTAGEYTIKVSYVENDYNFTASYGVEVIEEIAGLTVTKDRVDYVIGDEDGDGEVDENKTATTATISLEDLKVYAVTANETEPENEATYYDEDGSEDEDALDSGEYELKFFKGGEEISSLESLGKGIYTIYAYRDVTIAGKYSTIRYECGAYILCYVTDSLEEIEFNDVSAVTEQGLSTRDEMTGTWTFTLTYGSGNAIQLTMEDVEISNFYTTSPTAETGKEAKVTYYEEFVTSKERHTESVTVKVTYVIVAPEGETILKYSLDIDELWEASGEVSNATALQSSWFDTESNNFITYTPNSNTNTLRHDNSCIEVSKDCLSVTFFGTGEITIEFASTGSSWSNLGLKDSQNKYLQGSLEPQDNNELTEYTRTGDTGYTYEVYGNGRGRYVTYKIESPGTYKIETRITEYSDTSASSNPSNRGTRIYGIEMRDVIVVGSSEGAGDENDLATTTTPVSMVENLNLEDIDLSLPENLTGDVCGASCTEKAKN